MASAQTPTVQEFEGAALPHLNDLFRTAVRVVGDRTQAEDVVQEVYFQAWKSFHRFELGTNCRAWLFRILFHVVQHHRRKQSRLVLVDPADELENVLVAREPIPPTLADRDILTSLDRLPDTYREVVLLADVEEFSYREIADILEIPIGTVMSRLSRARALLRRELATVARSYGLNADGEAASERS